MPQPPWTPTVAFLAHFDSNRNVAWIPLVTPHSGFAKHERRRSGELVLTRAVALLLGVLCAFAWSSRGDAQHLSTYGTPGLIDMPTAEVLPGGYLGFTVSGFGSTVRGTMVFQMLPSVYGTFRYSMLKAALPDRNNLYDRSFDIHFQLREESNNWPATAVGLRDITGTGIYAGNMSLRLNLFHPGFRIQAAWVGGGLLPTVV